MKPMVIAAMLILVLPGPGRAQDVEGGTLETRVVPAYMVVQGAAMIAMWVPILATHPCVEADGFFRALGALAYTSLNSLNWALAERERLPYAIPMYVGLTGAGLSIGILW